MTFRRNVLSPFQGRRITLNSHTCTLKMEAERSSEVSVNFTRLHSVTSQKTMIYDITMNLREMRFVDTVKEIGPVSCVYIPMRTIVWND
jgi:hypothetical protein